VPTTNWEPEMTMAWFITYCFLGVALIGALAVATARLAPAKLRDAHDLPTSL
jgi:hypothetical protein